MPRTFLCRRFSDTSAKVPTSPSVQWDELLERIRKNEVEAIETLYSLTLRGIKIILVRQLGGGAAIDDAAHDVFIDGVAAIQKDQVQQAESFPAYLRKITQRRIYSEFEKRKQERKHLDWDSLPLPDQPTAKSNPERECQAAERVETATAAFRVLPSLHQELLKRFYLLEQSREQICEEMGLTETQFRLAKCRAKERFGEVGKRLQQRRKPSIEVVTSCRALYAS